MSKTRDLTSFCLDFASLPLNTARFPCVSKIIGVSMKRLWYVTYSCFDKGCPTKALKRTRQCRLVLWVERVWR